MSQPVGELPPPLNKRFRNCGAGGPESVSRRSSRAEQGVSVAPHGLVVFLAWLVSSAPGELLASW